MVTTQQATKLIYSLAARRSRCQKGQALAEMALMGTLVIAALGFLIQLGLTLNFEQENDQNAFRHALMVAKCEGDEQEPPNWCNDPALVPPGVDNDEESQAVTVLRLRDRQIPNPSIGFGLVPSSLTVGSASATWGERLTFLDDSKDSEPRIVVHLNDSAERMFRSGDFADDEPVISQIAKSSDMTGTVSQDNVTGSTTDTTTIETTTVTMNDGSQVSSSSSRTTSTW